MIKIFGGAFKGFALKAPPTSMTRPTSVLLRRKLFDSIQDMSCVIFVDLCAGTGAVGLEAASRNATEVYFVESQKACYRILVQNIMDIQKKFSCLTLLKSFQGDFYKWLTEHESLLSSEKSIYLFFDPPYEKIFLYEKLFDWISEHAFQGKVIIEACQQKTMSISSFQEKFGPCSKVFKQGSSYFMIYDF